MPFNETDPNAPQGGGYGGGGDIFSSLINLGGAIYSSEVSRQNTKKTIQANKEQAQYAYSKDLEMWNRQNQYNDPMSQMQRLKDAGLNPNLMYGSGSGGGGQASQMPKYNAPTLQYDYRPIDIAGVLSQYQDFRMKQAQIDNVKAQEENVRARTISESSRNTLLDVQGRSQEAELQHEQYIRPYQAAIVGNQARGSEAQLQQEWQRLQLMNQEELQKNLSMTYMKKQMSLMDIEGEKKQAELLYQQHKNDWMKAGITSSDNLMLRILVRMFNESGMTLDMSKLLK